jgi:DNA-directed RNA polymerase subunit RPC12/RpoP
MSIIGEDGFVRCGKCNTKTRIDMVLDTQDQRKAKGAAKCPHCGVYCATGKEGM